MVTLEGIAKHIHNIVSLATKSNIKKKNLHFPSILTTLSTYESHYHKVRPPPPPEFFLVTPP